jgi:hypothetical protein
MFPSYITGSVLMLVIGRSAAIIGQKGSFDICDDPEGKDGTRELGAAHERNAFGYQSKPRMRMDEIPLTGGEFGKPE